MSAFVVDTSAYSRHLLGEARAITEIRGAEEIHVPLIVLGEVLAGIAAGSRQAAAHATLSRFLSTSRVHLLMPNEKTAHEYADLFATLRRAGTPIPTNDLWIAALARQHRMPLLTFDSHFRVVPGLGLVLRDH